MRKGKGHALLNEDRMLRYERLNKPLYYIFWVYDFPPASSTGTVELYVHLDKCPKVMYSISGEYLHKFCRENIKMEKYIGGPGDNPKRGFNFYRVKEKNIKMMRQLQP